MLDRSLAKCEHAETLTVLTDRNIPLCGLYFPKFESWASFKIHSCTRGAAIFELQIPKVNLAADARA